MDRKQQQVELIELIGHVLRPLKDLCREPDLYDEMQRRKVRAQAIGEIESLQNRLRDFCRDGEIDYTCEWGEIGDLTGRLISVIRKHLVENPHFVASDLENIRPALFTAIAAIPSTAPPVIFDAQTPFTTFIKLRALFSTAAHEIVFVDRYVSADLFHRYFSAVDVLVPLTVITWPKNLHRGKQGEVRYNQFLDISRLFAVERPRTYRLLEHPNVHDRWMRFDRHLYHAGGSSKDAGESDYTLSRIDSAENHQKLDEFAAKGTELFGVTQPNHP